MLISGKNHSISCWLEKMQEEAFDILWTNLVERSYKKGVVPLSENERHFYTVNLLRGSVPRSGFIGYFENWTGRDIIDAHAGLRALGLHSVLALLEKAEVIVFGDKPIQPTSSRLEVFPDSLTEDEYEVESERLDEALGAISEEFCTKDESIWNALCRYADEHDLKPRS